jgi:ABC-type glycerol-3-phosphate transport system permease component
MVTDKIDKINKVGGLWNLLIGLVGAVGSIALAVVTSSITAYAIAAFMILGFVVALVSLLHMQLREREQMEARVHAIACVIS